MNNVFVLFKKCNVEIPNKEYLRNIYNKYNKNASYFTFSNCGIHANLNYDDFELLYSDLTDEVKKAETLLLVFTSKIGNFISNNNNKNFYTTKEPIFVFENEIKFADKMPFFNFKQYPQLFNMFLKQNKCMYITKNEIKDFGFDLKTDKGYFVSEILNNNFEQIEDLTSCYFCESKKENILINKCINICKDCFDKLNCFKCERCGEYFSNKYNFSKSKNICLECYTKYPIDKNCYIVDSWIGSEYITQLENNVPDNMNKRLFVKFLKNKTDKEINELRIKTFNIAVNHQDKLIKQIEIIIKRLSSPLMSL